jgi:MATE family multidrug resistance protein
MAEGRQGALGELLRLAWPVVLARLGIMTMGVVDSIVVGRHSSAELGYLQLGWAPTGVVLTTAVGLLVGVQVMTARHVGEGRPAATGAVLRRGMLYALVIGFAGALMLHFGGPWFLRSTELEPALAEGGGRVVQVLAWSLPTYCVAVVATFWLEALSKPGPGLVTMLIANVINLVLNLWLVPGALGVAGAEASAWATLGARLALMLMLLGYVAWWAGARQHGVYAPEDDGQGAAREQRRVGYGAGASYFVESAAFSGMTIVAGWLGGLDVAAWAIVLNLAALIFMVPLGLASATAVLVGRGYGARDRAALVQSGWLGMAVCTVVTGIICLVVWLGAEPIASAYTRDAALVAVTVPAVVLACLFFVADGVQVVAAQALRARGDVAVPTATHVISYAIVMLPLGYALAHPLGLGLAGIVWSIIIASLLAAGFLTARFALLARRPLG